MKCSHDNSIIFTGGFTNYMTIDSSTTYDGGNTRAFVAKIDSSGVLQWITTSSGAGGAGAKDITVANGNEIFIVGDIGTGQSTFGSHSISEANGVFAAKLLDNTSTLGINPEHSSQPSANSLQVFPNPTSGIFKLHFTHGETGWLEINIYDSRGRVVLKEVPTLSSSEFTKTIDLSKQPSGIYFIEAIINRKKYARQVILY